MSSLFFVGPALGSLRASEFPGRNLFVESRDEQYQYRASRKPRRRLLLSLHTRRTESGETPEASANRGLREVSEKDMRIHIHGLVARKTEKVVETKSDDSGIRGFFSSIRPKAYWESMGIIPWFALFGIAILGIKMVKVAFGVKESEQDAGPRRSMAAAQTEEEEKELHEYRCGSCGYVMYPARGREFKFFPDSFRCPLCQAPKSEFWDLRDPNDPRNQEEEEEDEPEQVVEETRTEFGDKEETESGHKGIVEEISAESRPAEGNGSPGDSMHESEEGTGTSIDASSQGK